MRKLWLFLVFISFGSLLYGGELSLRLNQKDVDISGKSEKFYVLFSEPVIDSKVSGPSKYKITIRKIIDRKNPLTKLPVTFTLNLDGKKVKEITINDRDGSAVIKDATMFAAGNPSTIDVDVPSGEHTLQFVVSKSAIKGLLLRVETEEAKAKEEPPVKMAGQAQKQETPKEKEFVPPIIPPLEPLVTPKPGKVDVTPAPPAQKVEAQVEKKEEKIEQQQKAEQIPKPAIKETPKEVKPEPVQEKISPPAVTSRTDEGKKGSFGDIVIFSAKGGVILPLVYGNPGGYGEFSTAFNLYRGVFIGASIASFNINRDYLVNDAFTGNSIAKYHLHGVPISGLIGYKYQMQNILTRLDIGLGVNMSDIDVRREHTATNLDTINSLQVNFGGEISYITKFGSAGLGLRYMYSNANNIEGKSGFVQDVNSGGLILSIGYQYGF